MAGSQKRLSTEVLSAIERLEKWGLTFNEQGLEQNLILIEASGEWAAIPRLLFMTAGSSKVEVQARHVVRSLMSDVPEAGYVRLDAMIRSAFAHGAVAKLRRPEPAFPILNWKRRRKFQVDVDVAGPLSSHPNGYIREEALLVLAGQHTGQEVPFLILRANDWVAPVAGVASKALLSRLDSRDFGDVLKLFWLAQNLENCQRLNHGSLVQELKSRLLAPQGLIWVADNLESCSARSQRAIARALAEGGGESAVGQLIAILKGSDAPSRTVAAKYLLDRGHLTQKQDVLDIILQDSNASLRIMAWRTLLSEVPEDCIDSINRALFDRSRTLRWFAICALREVGENPVERFRKRLSDAQGAALIPVVLGLSECGEAEDASLIRPLYDQTQTPKVRAAIVRAIGRLDLMTHQELLKDALLHDSPSVSRSAAESFQRSTDAWSIDNLIELVADRRLHVARNALWLNWRRGYGWCIEAAVSALAQGIPPIADLASRRLNHWVHHYNQGGQYYGLGQKNRIETQLDAAESKLPPHQFKHLKFLLDD